MGCSLSTRQRMKAHSPTLIGLKARQVLGWVRHILGLSLVALGTWTILDGVDRGRSAAQLKREVSLTLSYRPSPADLGDTRLVVILGVTWLLCGVGLATARLRED